MLSPSFSSPGRFWTVNKTSRLVTRLGTFVCMRVTSCDCGKVEERRDVASRGTGARDDGLFKYIEGT